MGKPQKIVLSIVAVVLYCLAASGFSDFICYRVKVDQHVESTGAVHFVAEVLPFAGNFAIKEGAGFWSGGNITPGSVKQSQVYKAINSAMEVQLACTISQFVSHFHNNPIRIRKMDMLFPFHYFFETDRA